MKKIVVIGDSCEDVFVYCGTNRLAPDFPIPVLQTLNETRNPGMAKNVQENIKSLHGSCEIVTNHNWQSVSKTRYVDHKTNHPFIRIDANEEIPRIDVKDIDLKKYDIVVVSDYDKGFLHVDDLRYICENHKEVFIDTKKILGDFADNAKIIKINDHEYSRSEPISDLHEQKMICTHGPRPTRYKEKEYPVEISEVKDVSGAGDTFLAGLVSKYAETGDIEEAIVFANQCASRIVRHRGVNVITHSDIA